MRYVSLHKSAADMHRFMAWLDPWLPSFPCALQHETNADFSTTSSHIAYFLYLSPLHWILHHPLQNSQLSGVVTTHIAVIIVRGSYNLSTLMRHAYPVTLIGVLLFKCLRKRWGLLQKTIFFFFFQWSWWVPDSIHISTRSANHFAPRYLHRSPAPIDNYS